MQDIAHCGLDRGLELCQSFQTAFVMAGTAGLKPAASPVTAAHRLTAEAVKNLSAASGVAYREFGAILASLVAPNPAPKSKHALQKFQLFGGGNAFNSGISFPYTLIRVLQGPVLSLRSVP